MLDCSLIKYSLKLLINKHIRHVLYLQFTMNVFQIYFLNAVNKVIFYNDLKIFRKTYITNLFQLHVFSCTLLMSQVHSRCTFTRVHLIFEALMHSIGSIHLSCGLELDRVSLMLFTVSNTFFICFSPHGCKFLIIEVVIYSFICQYYWVLLTICLILVLFHFAFCFMSSVEMKISFAGN